MAFLLRWKKKQQQQNIITGSFSFWRQNDSFDVEHVDQSADDSLCSASQICARTCVPTGSGLSWRRRLPGFSSLSWCGAAMLSSPLMHRCSRAPPSGWCTPCAALSSLSSPFCSVTVSSSIYIDRYVYVCVCMYVYVCVCTYISRHNIYFYKYKEREREIKLSENQVAFIVQVLSVYTFIF